MWRAALAVAVRSELSPDVHAEWSQQQPSRAAERCQQLGFQAGHHAGESGRYQQQATSTIMWLWSGREFNPSASCRRVDTGASHSATPAAGASSNWVSIRRAAATQHPARRCCRPAGLCQRSCCSAEAAPPGPAAGAHSQREGAAPGPQSQWHCCRGPNCVSRRSKPLPATAGTAHSPAAAGGSETTGGCGCARSRPIPHRPPGHPSPEEACPCARARLCRCL